MADLAPTTLKNLWQSGQQGRLSPWQVARALALREASKECHGGQANLPWVASRVTKIGGGNPCVQSLCDLFAKIDADPDWYPGKHSAKKRGPKPLFNAAKRQCVARSAMAAKSKHDQEPSVTAVCLACPAATHNPNTGKPFCDVA